MCKSFGELNEVYQAKDGLRRYRVGSAKGGNYLERLANMAFIEELLQTNTQVNLQKRRLGKLLQRIRKQLHYQI